ncbi:MAG TPA: GGDEF domain-containing protein [Thermosulfurimonas dismutans]|uniref:diguanylate cyclase n=1 Tax=Thermosulfurimonas dismutans TaxID=999894 RepID=A0A7C3GTD9_9BACT|nr:GGDEF domain-containing protein [Thermosulfurimonas dismutans]
METACLRFKFLRPLNWILNRSLFWKVGFIIGVCVLVNSLIAFYFFTKLNFLGRHLEQAPFYSYKTLVQEGLRLLQKEEALPPDSPRRLLLREKIRELARVGLKGGTFEGENGLTIQILRPVTYPPARQALQRILKHPEGPGVRAALETVLSWVQKEEDRFLHELENLSRRLGNLYILLFIVLAVFLIWGAVGFLFMVKFPLDRIAGQLDRLLKHGDESCAEDVEECVVKHYAKDEIGVVAEKVNELVRYFADLAIFKHTIEEDQNPEEVYYRLAEVFREKLELPVFALYEVSNSQNTMRPVVLSQPDLEVNAEKFFNANLCRAKRTGHVVSSLEYPGVCRLFLHPDECEHYCVPFMSGGLCIGIAQIFLPKGMATRKMKHIKEKLRTAERYIAEAVPVLEAKRYAQSLREQTLKDPLTGLYNRRFLEEALDNLVAGVLRRKTVLGILMADLDYFKSVNDKYGHDVGDRVLRETAEILKKNVRSSDLVVRFGGEEFLILLVDVRSGESEKIAEKLRAAVETHQFETPKGLIRRTISIGVSEFPTDAQGIWEAIKYADVALYKAKEAGRNRVVRFTPDMWPSEEY